MTRVAILCPTRDRPKQLADLVRSVIGTSDAQVLAYIDEDQTRLYQWVFEPAGPKNLTVRVGTRIGPCAAANLLLKENPNFGAYGFFCDDCRVTVSGWDRFVTESLGEKIGAVAPAHARTDVDFPFVSKAWIEALGWYCWPGFYHWGWPSLIAALGDATGTMVRAEPGQFWFDHDILSPKNRDRYPDDIVSFYDYFANHFAGDLARLQKAIRG